MFFLSCFVFMSFCLSSCSHQGEEEFFISIIWAAWWLWANKIKKVAQIVCRTQNNRYLCNVKKCWWKPSSLHQHSKRIICGLYLCRASHYFFKHERNNHNQTSGPPQPNEWTNHGNRLAPLTATTGPSPVPSPVGRGVITEIPLSSCWTLLTVLFAVVSHAVLRTLLPYLYILKAQLSIFILSSFVILSFCLNTLKTLLNFFFLSLYVFMSLCL